MLSDTIAPEERVATLCGAGSAAVPLPALTATSTSMVVVAVVTVAFALDHPEQPLRLMEEPPELADVHVCPAFFSTTTTPSIQSYQTSREKLLVLPNPV